MTSVNFLYPNGAIKAATFTFDDGINFDKKFINILNGCGMKGTFCVNSGEFDENICWPTRDGKDMIKKINTDEVAAAYEGHEVCIHGYNHIYWTNHPREQMFEAIYHDKCTLEELVGYPIRGIAYPFSSVDEHTVNIAKLLGLRYGRIAGEEPFFQLPEDMYRWAPTCSHWAPNLMDRAKLFVNENFNTQSLFCVSGHTFDFANANCWDKIEALCDFLAHRENIWYATAGQIFDYVHATKEVLFMANCSAVYNPTATEIWLMVGKDNVVRVRPGETLKLW